MGERLLLSGARVMTMDPALGVLDRADVLIEGDRIRAIERTLSGVDARTVDVSGKVLLPGMIDAHRHTWQTPLRGLGADWTVLDYLAAVRIKLAPAFTPEDVYWANYAGALEALEAGVTTLVDYAHCIHSPEHAAAALRGLEDAGVRALFAYGFASYAAAGSGPFPSYQERLDDLRALARDHRSSRLRLGAALTEMQVPWEQTLDELRCARELGLPITFHSTAFPMPGKSEIERLHDEGLLGPDLLLVHCTHASEDDLRRVADSGASICATPETELQMGMGMPVVGRALRHGVRTTLGCDVVCSNNGDPFAMLRLALQVERGLANARAGLPLQLELAADRMLPMVTRDAAAAIGAGPELGTLAPGKRADLVVLSTTSFNLLPGVETPGALVTQAHAANVESVLVDGRFVKENGQLRGIDRPRIQRALEASRAALLERTGGAAQLLSARPELLRHWNVGQSEVGAGTASSA